MAAAAIDDLRHACRTLWRAPFFFGFALLTLILGIGGSTAVFAVANAVLLRDLQYARSEELASLDLYVAGSPSTTHLPTSTLDLWSSQGDLVAGASGYNLGEVYQLLSTGEPVRLSAAWVSPGFLRLLGITMFSGRSFVAGDAVGAPKAAVVRYAVWRDRLGGREGDARIILNGREYSVVGVLPESFRFPNVVEPDVLIPLPRPDAGVTASIQHSIVRLRPTLSLDAVEQRLDLLFHSSGSFREKAGQPGDLKSRLQVTPLVHYLASPAHSLMAIAGGIAVVMVLISAANVAGLQVARLVRRERELAIRVAIGSTRSRLARLVLVEGLVVGLSAALGSIVAVQLVLRSVRPALAGVVHDPARIAVDERVALFALVAGLVCAVVCALVPVVHISLRGMLVDIRSGAAWSPSGAKTQLRIAEYLSTAQIAGAVVLIVAAMLFTITVRNLSSDVGFDSGSLLTMRVPGYSSVWMGPRTQRLQDIVDRVRAVPAVTAAAATTSLPLDGHSFKFGIPVAGLPASPDDATIGVDVVTPSYFVTLGATLVVGRDFRDTDTQSSPSVAVVNRAFVRWKGLSESSAVGRRLAMGGGPEDATVEIVGVVSDIKESHPIDGARPIVYRPFTQAAPNISWGTANIVARAGRDPMEVSELVRQAIQDAVPGSTVYDVRPMSQRVAGLVVSERQRAQLAGVSGGAGLLLAAVGLYGLLSYVVSGRMKEFGIRMALGASRRHIVLRVAAQCSRIVMPGSMLGLVGGLIAERTLLPGLYVATGHRAAAFVGATVLIVVVASLAGLLPAHRALRAEPLEVLRLD